MLQIYSSSYKYIVYIFYVVYVNFIYYYNIWHINIIYLSN